MLNKYMEFAKEIASYAGKIMLEYFNLDKASEYKEDETIVTIVDKKINKHLIEKVKEKYPEHSVIGEEESYGNSNQIWICDPIDGTAMYARKIPVSVFSLAFMIDGEPLIGVVYDPFTNNLYSAIKGQGAYKNNEKINVSSIDLNDKRSVSHYDMWKDSEYDLYDAIKELGKNTYLISIGSIIRASMCVAQGDFTFAIFPGTINKNCDIAAVKIIVEEAGGIVTDIFGNNQKYDKNIKGAIISNKVVYKKIIDILKKVSI